ncbi:ActS/PrrB/RegB family redox-sensitive histidine kinase [Chelatococcus sp. SYSU_G07232]|uniref:histidine kinase n=1 Tax=Chelatococcus albus TaxID=3047466 RepID=A0ABT7AJ29_9HYPH|nr:ActS/PrrB/RegB family redox-sensitive histidine kinase [Chelatococcus sp. SYSU_G07232]MDJ1158814.1 ActS/PrrB/RegB family redox-sensitive histidine kinase [Chelatococcus sp. SYSU_G07232]
MADTAVTDPGRDAQHLRLDTLVRLRWLAVIGQSTAVAGVHFGLGFPLPFGLCFLAIAISAWLNIALRIRYPVSYRLGDTAASILLGYDILQLAALLYLTGGLENPFALLFLAPVLISATALPPGRTLVLGILAVISATALVFYHRPLPWIPGETLQLPFLYVAGIWCAILLGLAFTGVYAWRVAEEARDLAAALTATELVLAREQHLSQLDGLAAAAAHELGTPLATITLVAKELSRLAPKEGPFTEDIALLRDQVDRCREILGKLTSLSTEEAGPLEHMTLSHLIEEVAGPQRPFGVPITVVRQGEAPEPVCRRNPGILYGLGNLVDNALDFARAGVGIEARWTSDSVSVTVHDDGPGFAPEVLLRLGEPYVTTRGAHRRGTEDAGSGLGLGLFIAKTLLERSGASITFTNAAAPEHGAVVTVAWPRAAFERDLPPAARATRLLHVTDA